MVGRPHLEEMLPPASCTSFSQSILLSAACTGPPGLTNCLLINTVRADVGVGCVPLRFILGVEGYPAVRPPRLQGLDDMHAQWTSGIVIYL